MTQGEQRSLTVCACARALLPPRQGRSGKRTRVVVDSDDDEEEMSEEEEGLGARENIPDEKCAERSPARVAPATALSQPGQ